MKPRFHSILAGLSASITLFQSSAQSSTGILRTGDLSLAPGSSLEIELSGPVVGIEYDQIDVTGTVSLNDAILSLTLGFTPTSGTQFTIIKNDLSDPVDGTFSGLPDGAVFTVSAEPFQISYEGGDGNDVVLTAGATTIVPDSGATWILLSASIAAMIAFRRTD
ncbi:MAG: VPDSG-CTERM sorting domain-containing protein [Verrucomicrobiales bacterium]|nr:VPDSG-CTERM sorting domain-containing protein [Verrucomicrobiales bacterium]